MQSPIKSPSNATPPKTFSPVHVPESPLSSQKGQLRGTPRTVRDAAAEVFNSIQQWNRLHIDGMNTINDIMDKKLKQLNKPQDEKNVNEIYPEGLEDHCNKLDEICSQLNLVVSKMKGLLKNFEAIKKLEDMNRTAVRPIFTTWTAEKYVEVLKEVYQAYSKEIQVKFHVKENIGHVDTKANLMLHCTLWAHQPYVDNIIDFHIEAMLKETGHR